MDNYYQIRNKPMSLKKLAIISLFVAGVIVIVSIILSSLMKHYQSMKYVAMEEYPESMPVELREGLGAQIKSLLEQHEGAKENDIVTAVIREGTYFEKTEDEITNASFLVDIESFKQTYVVDMAWSDTKEISDGIIIRCPNKSQSMFPDSFCKSMYDTSKDVENIENNPLYSELPISVDEFDFSARRAIHYEIRGTFDDNGNLVLTIVDYSGGQVEAAKKKIKELGYNPNDYVIKYYDDSGDY